MTMDAPNRRVVLGGAAAIGAGAALAACGAKSSSDAGTPASRSSGASGAEIGKASDVPVGGGKIFADKKVVVTQLTKGDFKAYSAVCTHQGCIVSSIDKTEIHCPCHGGAYSIKDGSVVGGPAPAPLAPEMVADDAGTLKLT